jgi:hypothetical protein
MFPVEFDKFQLDLSRHIVLATMPGFVGRKRQAANATDVDKFGYSTDPWTQTACADLHESVVLRGDPNGAAVVCPLDFRM